MSTTTSVNRTNGVNVSGLMETLGAIKNNTELADFKFRAANQWLGGTRNRSTIQSFYGAGKEDDTRTQPYVMDCDEPPILMGRDKGANPVEYLLTALAGCVTTSMVMHAASRDIQIESIQSHLEGDIDVRGFTGLDPDVTKGYKTIRMKMKVKTTEDAAKLKALAQMSPVYNTITQPTRVEIDIVTE